MKKYIHPSTSSTQIQMKDGSSYTKNWLYRRSTLTLEEDYKQWETTKDSVNNWFYFMTRVSKSVSAVPTIKKNINSFWK